MKLPKFSFQKNQNLKYIYAIRLLRELVNKLVMFFLPIYFFHYIVLFLYIKFIEPKKSKTLIKVGFSMPGGSRTHFILD